MKVDEQMQANTRNEAHSQKEKKKKQNPETLRDEKREQKYTVDTLYKYAKKRKQFYTDYPLKYKQPQYLTDSQLCNHNISTDVAHIDFVSELCAVEVQTRNQFFWTLNVSRNMLPPPHQASMTPAWLWQSVRREKLF